MSDNESPIRTVTLPDYDWRIIVNLLRAAANRQRKNVVSKHTYTDLANWVDRQANGR